MVFDGFTSEDFSGLNRITEINEKYWDFDNKKYSDKKFESEARENIVRVRDKLRELIAILKARFTEYKDFEIGLSSIRPNASVTPYKHYMWVYFVRSQAEEHKENQVQLQIDIKGTYEGSYNFFSTASIWFEPNTEKDRKKFLAYINQRIDSDEKVIVRIYDNREKKLIINEIGNKKNLDIFKASLEDKKYKLGLEIQHPIEKISKLDGEELIQLIHDDLQYIKTKYYDPVFSASYTPVIEENFSSGSSIPLNRILYGVPGTGKTFVTKEISEMIIHSNNKQNHNRRDTYG